MQKSSPTAAELAILRVLWRAGPSSVGDVHQAVYADGAAGYTSALKLLQNMLAKGLVSREARGRQHIYAAAAPEGPTLNAVVKGWADAAFAGSPLALAMQALDAQPVSAEELSDLKALIARIEAGQG